MRRVVALILVAGSLTACGADEKGITLIQGVANEPFYTSMYCGAKEEADKRGLKLTVQAAPKWDVAAQTDVVNAVAARRPTAVLVAPVDKDAMLGPVKQLAENSKVVLVDTDLTDASVGLSRISSDNALGGKLGATALAKQIGDKGKVMLLSPKEGIATTDERVRGFRDEMAKNPGVQIVATQYPGDDSAKSQDAVAATLAAHPDLAGVFAANLVTGEGAAAALKGASKVGTVKLVEFDASPKQVEDLKAGTIQALISQEPLEIGRKGVEQAVAAIDGKPTEKQLKTQLLEVTKDNVGDPNIAKYLYKTAC